MKNNNGFTLIELLAVIIVLAIVTVLGATTVLPYMSKARENAFRIEATEIVNSAKEALHLYDLSQIKLKNNTASCKKANTNEYCFTVAELINLGIYDGDAGTFSGKIEANLVNSTAPIYTLYFKKNDEFKIIGENRENYKDYGNLSLATWEDEYSACNCS